MDKLRLIKPWHLQPIHQRLEGIRNQWVVVSNTTPCTGPRGELPAKHNLRKEGSTPIKKKPNNAPVSDVIFASVCNKNIR